MTDDDLVEASCAVPVEKEEENEAPSRTYPHSTQGVQKYLRNQKADFPRD